MKKPSRRRPALSFVATALVLVVACGGSGGAGGAARVLGEKLTTRVIDDPAQKIPAGVVAVPESWSYEAKITWNYANYSVPVTSSQVAKNPANDKAIFGFGNLSYFDLRPGGYHQRGRMYGGQVYAVPAAAVQTLAAFIRQQRDKEQGFTFVGSKDLPDLPAALKMQPANNQHGVGIKVTYTANGKPIEEEFYAVGYQNQIPYDGPQAGPYLPDQLGPVVGAQLPRAGGHARQAPPDLCRVCEIVPAKSRLDGAARRHQ